MRRRLSPHFAAHEFDEHTGKHWPPDCRDQLELLCIRFLEPLRRAFGPITIVSGYRSEAYNRRVGGASQSYHVWTADRRGIAVDLRASRGKPTDWARVAERCGPGGLHAYDSWLHLDSRGSPARW